MHLVDAHGLTPAAVAAAAGRVGVPGCAEILALLTALDSRCDANCSEVPGIRRRADTEEVAEDLDYVYHDSESDDDSE